MAGPVVVDDAACDNISVRNAAKEWARSNNTKIGYWTSSYASKGGRGITGYCLMCDECAALCGTRYAFVGKWHGEGQGRVYLLECVQKVNCRVGDDRKKSKKKGAASEVERDNVKNTA